MAQLIRKLPHTVLQSTIRRSIHTTSAAANSIFNIQTPDEFEEKVLKSKTPIVIDFFATWCGPCKMLTPRIESVIGESKGKIALAKVDIDEHSDLALNYNVSSVPVLVAMQNGKEVNRMVGLQDTDKLRTFVESFGKKK